MSVRILSKSYLGGIFFLEHAKQRVIFIEKKAQEAQAQRGNKKRDPTDPQTKKGRKRNKGQRQKSKPSPGNAHVGGGGLVPVRLRTPQVRLDKDILGKPSPYRSNTLEDARIPQLSNGFNCIRRRWEVFYNKKR